MFVTFIQWYKVTEQHINDPNNSSSERKWNGEPDIANIKLKNFPDNQSEALNVDTSSIDGNTTFNHITHHWMPEGLIYI